MVTGKESEVIHGIEQKDDCEIFLLKAAEPSLPTFASTAVCQDTAKATVKHPTSFISTPAARRPQSLITGRRINSRQPVRAQGGLSADSILLANTGLQVPLGRSVYLSQKDLQIRVSLGHRCSVTVLDNDPLTQRPGRLMPTTFPCDFAPEEVIYSHFGSRNPPSDRINLQIRYDSLSETLLIPLTIQVEVSFVQLEVVTRNLPLEVDKLLGVSTPMDQSVMEFAYDKDSGQQCKVTVLGAASGLPRYGVVTNDTRQLEMVDCQRFLTMGVRYRHTADTQSPNRDFLPLVVEILDPAGNMLKQEYFQTLVQIKEGQQNERPTPSFNARMSLEVDQFVMTALTPDILAAEDVETDNNNLIFNITQPLLPGQGHFVSTDDRNQPVTSFYQSDVRQFKIAYKPPREDSDKRRVVVAEIEVVDSDGATSDPFILMVNVKPMNTLAPVVTTNTGLQLFEGQSRPLHADRNLFVSDEDNVQDVKVMVAAGLRHGRLVVPDDRDYFTADDLVAGTVLYQHDDSDTYSDNIIFRMTDGQNEVEFLFPVWIFPEDDEAPILNVNTGLEIRKKEVVEITPFVLSATDIDSDDASIKFIILPPFSEEGQILIRQFEEPADAEWWVREEGVYERVVDQFSQNDLLDGKLFYRHVGPHRTDVILDHIYFRLQDDAVPPNESDIKEFIVKISPVDDQPPYLYPGTSLQMEVDEFQVTEFKRKVLRYTDDDADDRELKYHVTVAPFDTDSNTPLDAGQIVLCDDDTLPLTFFTQAQVNHRKVCFKPPSAELGVVPRILQFFYDVEDPAGNVLTNQRFTVLLHPMDNQPPRITHNAISISENGYVVLTPDILSVEDPDTDGDQLVFEVMELPLHGSLQYGDSPLGVGDLFTWEDLANDRLSYRNAGDDDGSDNFMIDVTDGVHHVPIKLNVDITSVDDETPTLVGVTGGVLTILIRVNENSAVTLSADDLKASDPDTDDLLLTFTLEQPPYEGLLMREGQQTTEFTQADLREKLVEYQHTGGEIGPEGRNDSFVLVLTDGREDLLVSGSPIDKIIVAVLIRPVDSEPPIVSMGQPFEVLESDKAPILPRHLDATDIDTEDTDVMCMIVVQPTNGYVENVSPAPGSEQSRVGIPVSSFTIRDIRMGFVNYVQSVHQGLEPRQDEFSYQCSDGLNFSPKFVFTIEIYPTNDEEPEVSLREFMVVEGGNLMIDLPILNVVDGDEPADVLTFVITQQPQHGVIVRQTRDGSFPITNFTLDDISGASTIEYEHDDTETTADVFSFYLLDGQHNVSRTVPIKVFPVDDETPVLTINNGLEMDKAGETKIIGNDLLKAEDLDSNDSSLTFIVRQKPKFGYLQKITAASVTNLTQGMNFTQKDVDLKFVHYTHTGVGGIRDLIKLDVTDGLNPLIDRYFYVTVEGLDMVYPTVINKGVELPEAGTAILTTGLLSGADLNSPDENLQFIVTRAPTRGYLESSDHPGVPITTFSQLELAGNKVRYVHSSGDEMKMDSFEFEVTDGFNPVARTFRISLSDVDNRKPVLMFQPLRLKEGDLKLITPFELKAEDRDTPDASIVFTVTQVPIHGLLLYNSSRVVTVFSMADLNENLVSYQHDQSETAIDSFSFTLTDGTHSDFFVYPETTLTTRRPQTMRIEVTPVDNGIPQVSINRGASSMSELGGDTLGYRISPRVLSVEDRDSPDDGLLYVLSVAPRYGYIINRALGNRSISNWTQAQRAIRLAFGKPDPPVAHARATGNRQQANRATGNRAAGNRATGNRQQSSRQQSNRPTEQQATEQQANRQQSSRATGNRAAGNRATGQQSNRQQSSRQQSNRQQSSRATGQQATEQQATGNRAAGQQATEQQANRQQSNRPTGNRAAGQQATEQQATGNRAAGQQATEQQANRATGQQATEQQATEQQANRQQSSRPTGNRATGQQATDQQATEQQATEQQANRQQSSRQQSSRQQSSRQQSSRQQSNRPAGNRPAGNRAAGQQATEQQATEQQASRQQTSRQQTSRQQSSRQQTSRQQSSRQQSSRPTGNRAAGNRAAGNRATGQQATGQQATEQQGTDQQATGQQATEQQASRQQTSRQQSSRPAGNRAAGNRAAGQQATDQQATDQQATEQQATDQQATEQQATEQQANRQQSSRQQSNRQQTTGNRPTDQQANRPTDQQTNRQQTNRPTGQQNNRPTGQQATDQQANRQQTNRPTDQQTNRQQTNRPTDQQANRPTDQQTNMLTGQQTNRPTEQ
ncbi:hypothetical protein ACOMHN_047627 [Nucella lapillus]